MALRRSSEVSGWDITGKQAGEGGKQEGRDRSTVRTSVISLNLLVINGRCDCHSLA